MAQVLSTFSRLEQSRFEAFRRATFPKDAIAKYVAHCLIEEQHRPVSQGDPMVAAVESRQAQQPRSKPLRQPILKDVVAPGQAEDITIVVSTLAKAYAQRLVTAARRHANIRSTTEAAAAASDNNSQFSTPNKKSPRKASSATLPTAITPQDIIKALEERKAQGLDPGFFLQPWEQSQSVLVDNDIYQQKRLAALHAQEQWDKKHGGTKGDDGEEDDGKPKANDDNDATRDGKDGDDKKDEAVPMEVSSPTS